MASPSALVIGSTGLVGNEALSALTTSSLFPTLQTISRRSPKQTSPKLQPLIQTDTTTWCPSLKALQPVPHTVISALGTTRAQAGGLANQWKIDHDLNVEIAKASKEVGVKTFVFVSSGGGRSIMTSSTPYFKMKNGVEDTVMSLGFENAIILRPGFIIGQREQSRLGETMMHHVVGGIGRISAGMKNSLGQEASVIGRAAVRAAELAKEGKAEKNPWILEAKDIIRLGSEQLGPKKTEVEHKSEPTPAS